MKNIKDIFKKSPFGLLTLHISKVDECIKILRSKRDIVNINTQFAKNLQDYWEYCRDAKNKEKTA